MSDAEFYRRQARRCRELLRSAVQPEITEQLWRWVAEFEQMAAALETSSARDAADN